MLFFQNYSNLYPPNKTLCAHIRQTKNSTFIIDFLQHYDSNWKLY
ncbi:hypothetical protein [Spiroplasma endosymbiont of Dilophus febrilis]